MPPQVTKKEFASALRELGHNPDDYAGKKIALTSMCELYDLHEDVVLEAVELKQIAAHYDYMNDTIWIDALDAAHFFYCVRSEAHLYSA